MQYFRNTLLPKKGAEQDNCESIEAVWRGSSGKEQHSEECDHHNADAAVGPRQGEAGAGGVQRGQEKEAR